MKQIALAGAIVTAFAGALAVGSFTRGDGEPRTASGKIAFIRGGALVVANEDGSAPRTLVVPRKGEDLEGPVWTSTARIVFWKSSLSTASGSERSIAQDGSDERAAGAGVGNDVSPDGKLRITVHSTPGGKSGLTVELGVKDLRGGARERRLTRGGMLMWYSWAPDSRAIVYAHMVGDILHPVISLWAVRADGTGSRQLTKGPFDTMPAWSPDGSQIAFISGRDHNGESCNDDRCDPNGELYVMRADGKDPRRLTHTRAQEMSPAWRPDGRRIAFIRGESYEPNSELYATNTQGTCERRLTRDAARVEAFAYSPDASGPACPAATQPPVGPAFDYGSSLRPADLISITDQAIYWLGSETRFFSLTEIQRQPAGPMGHTDWTLTTLSYACAPTAIACDGGVFVQTQPSASRPALAVASRLCLTHARGVPVIRYPDRVDVFTGTAIVTIHGSRRDVAHALAALSAANGAAGRPSGQRLPPPPPDAVDAPAC